MNYMTIKEFDIANGIGVRVSLFVSGCRHHCKGCFNQEAWPFDAGQPYTKETQEHIINLLKQRYISGLSLLGGEPFEPENQEVLYPLLEKVKETYNNKDIWCYTGFTLEELKDRNNSITNKMLAMIDTLVDGRFEEDKKDIMLKYRGSSNQRIWMKNWKEEFKTKTY